MGNLTLRLTSSVDSEVMESCDLPPYLGLSYSPRIHFCVMVNLYLFLNMVSISVCKLSISIVNGLANSKFSFAPRGSKSEVFLLLLVFLRHKFPSHYL
jgi:hypothetical protein